MLKIFFIVISLVSSFIDARTQEYPKDFFAPPLKGTLLMTGNFCELRKNHFHGGLDFRGNTGTPIYAVADGYISRIKISRTGYGYALYLTHNQEYISNYGHLDRFTDDVAQWVYDKQHEIQKFEFDLNLDSNLFPVKKGQLIGYMGNRGYSFGPHLHFEIRNINDEPINPQHFGFKITDRKRPEIMHIAIYLSLIHISEPTRPY